MSIYKADIVQSAAGRDSGKFFFVMEAEGDFLSLADGKVRKIEHPKRKKVKHVRFVARLDSEVAEKIRRNLHVQNSELRRALALCSRQLDSQNQGGL